MDLLNVPAATTSSGSTKVLIQDGNTLKSRTASDLVSGSSGKFFQTTIFGSSLGNGYNPCEIGIPSDRDAYGWPCDTGWTQQDTIDAAYKFLIPFIPTNYRITLILASNPIYSGGGTPNGGEFGVKFQYSTDNGSNWYDITTVGFRQKSFGNFVDSSGSLSLSGTNLLVRILTVHTLSLNGNDFDEDATIQARAFIANFWT